MRHRILCIAGAVVAVTLAWSAGAAAQPSSPIVRPDPDQERTLPLVQLGAQLFAGNCAKCHGDRGEGRAPSQEDVGPGSGGAGPPLKGVGALAADFYLRTGYMPLANPHEQPQRAPILFHEREIQALTAFVASLGKGPAIPHPDPRAGRLERGRELFTQHCSGCHQVMAQGGVVTGARVPPLQKATARQVAEAVRIGPYLMPKFSQKVISDRDLRDIVRYVEWTKHPSNEGGWGISNLGPFPEGMVTWLIAIVALVATCIIIGKRVSSS